MPVHVCGAIYLEVYLEAGGGGGGRAGRCGACTLQELQEITETAQMLASNTIKVQKAWY